MRARPCYACEQLRDPSVKHVCVPWPAPAPGTHYELEVTCSDRAGLFGAYSVDIIGGGKVGVGLMSSRKECEKLLRIRGFSGPFVWPTVEETIARRAAKRDAKLAKKAVTQAATKARKEARRG